MRNNTDKDTKRFIHIDFKGVTTHISDKKLIVNL
jgi:hypothetical protein